MPKIKVRQGDQWVDANNVYVRQGDQWVRIGPNKKENTEDEAKEELKEWLNKLKVNDGELKRKLISKGRMDLALLISILLTENLEGLHFDGLTDALKGINEAIGTKFNDYLSMGDQKFYTIVFHSQRGKRTVESALIQCRKSKPGFIELDRTWLANMTIYYQNVGNVPLFKNKSEANQVAINIMKFLKQKDSSVEYSIIEIDNSKYRNTAIGFYWYLRSCPLIKVELYFVDEAGQYKVGNGYLLPTNLWGIDDFKLEI